GKLLRVTRRRGGGGAAEAAGPRDGADDGGPAATDGTRRGHAVPFLSTVGISCAARDRRIWQARAWVKPTRRWGAPQPSGTAGGRRGRAASGSRRRRRCGTPSR